MKLKHSFFLNFIFVFFQFGGIGFILLSGPVFAWPFYLLLLETVGILIGLWAINSMKIENLRILPDLKHDAKLTQKGPYHFVRHPMYLAIIITLLPLIISKFTVIRLLIFLIICFDLTLKLHYEEKLLKSEFRNYSDYQKNTYRLIPFIY